MAPISDGFQEVLRGAIGDETVVEALSAMDLTDGDIDTLIDNLRILSVPGSRGMWPDAATWLEMETQEMLAQAAAAVERIAAAEVASGGPVLRDCVTMMLELMHHAGDPAVMARSPDDWLWGPTGPPQRGGWTGLDPAGRYETHASLCGREWSRRVWKSSLSHEGAVIGAALDEADAAMQTATDAVDGGLDAAQSARAALDEGRDNAAIAPNGPWPAAMLEWSALGWNTAQMLRGCAETVLAGAVGAGVAYAAGEYDTYEERGVLIVAARARGAVLGRWWEQIAPKRPDSDIANPASTSFWEADADPADFWTAAVRAAVLEVGRAQRGGEPEALAAALLNR